MRRGFLRGWISGRGALLSARCGSEPSASQIDRLAVGCRAGRAAPFILTKAQLRLEHETFVLGELFRGTRPVFVVAPATSSPALR